MDLQRSANMKKAISVAAIVVGVLALLSVAVPVIIGNIFEMTPPESVGIIGGADGPTAIMLAGTVGSGTIIIAVAIGALLITAGILGLVKIKK